mmetsp:Transcript_65884/g.122980  ORF Transcript_65884/g.122980 Transcript_65884/m.122980 type:complete len:379 (-) Transcript_65884:22-1158(-)
MSAAAQQDVRTLEVHLPEESHYLCLKLLNAAQPHSWHAVSRLGRTYSLTERLHAERFFQHVSDALQVDREQIYISVSQKDDGQHEFVSFGEAAEVLASSDSARVISLLPEEVVKALQDRSGAVLLYARPGETHKTAASASTGAGAAASRAAQQAMQETPSASDASRADSGGQLRPQVGQAALALPDELCPRKSPLACNYSVIPELSLGYTQRLILCDEATLTRSLPEERIFEHLVLIVNCHESSPWPRDKYKVGACRSSSPPKVIYQEVHKWHSLGAADMNQRNDEIQNAMWTALQSGTVAVHCLAGIHRAACIVACHFLWRHYLMGHQDIPSDPDIIYRCMQAVRPAVSMGYVHVLKSYQEHLLRRRKTALRGQCTS